MKLKGRGGRDRGQGRRPPGSFRPEDRIALFGCFIELKWKFAMEGAPNPVEAAGMRCLTKTTRTANANSATRTAIVT